MSKKRPTRAKSVDPHILELLGREMGGSADDFVAGVEQMGGLLELLYHLIEKARAEQDDVNADRINWDGIITLLRAHRQRNQNIVSAACWLIGQESPRAKAGAR